MMLGDGGEGAGHVPAAEGGAAVAPVDRLVAARRGAGRRDRPAARAGAGRTSTSTVGRPRESQTRRALTAAMAVTVPPRR